MMKRNHPAAQPGQLAERRAPPADTRGARFAGFAADSYDADARTVEAVLSSGSAVRRWYFTEELAIEEGAVDLSRVDSGLVSLLDTHNQYEIDAVLGQVSSVRIENSQLIGLLHFADTERGRDAELRVARGELRGVSIGYRVTKWEITQVEDDHETWRAAAWELLEVSLVPVPADANAGIRSTSSQAPGNGTPAVQNEEDDMNRSNPGGAGAPTPTLAATPAPAPAPAVRAADPAPAPAAVTPDPVASRFTPTQATSFVSNARAISPTLEARATELVGQNERGEIGVEAATTAIMTAAAEAQRAATGNVQTNARAIEIPEAQFAARAAAMTGAILHRIDPSRNALADEHRDFRGQNLRGLARSFLESTGISTRGMSDIEVAQSAMMSRSAGMHSTSDFPNILGSVVRRTLRNAYELAPRSYQTWSRRTTFTDFRTLTRVALSGAPMLKQVVEHGEYEYGTMGESAESIKALKYGRIIAVTWEAIINDDLNALSRIPAAFGSTAAQMESDIMYDSLLANANMSDSVALFASGHGNLAGSGTAITIASLGAARAAMRKQTSPDGQPLNLSPGILLVGPDKEVEAQQLLAAVVATTSSAVNPFAGSLQLVVDPRITGNAWYLFADPTTTSIDTFEYGFLDGEEGVMIEQRQGFEVDGLEIKARLVFGGGPIDWRGMYRNPGA